MAAAEQVIKVETKAYGLWRLALLIKAMRWVRVPLWIVTAVVSTTGVKTKVHAGRHPRKWQRARLYYTTQLGQNWDVTP